MEQVSLELEETCISLGKVWKKPECSWLYLLGRRKTRPYYVRGGFVIDKKEFRPLGFWFKSNAAGQHNRELALEDSSHLLVAQDGFFAWYVGIPLSKQEVKHLCAVPIGVAELERLGSFFLAV